jgi:hypothetical protein
MPPFSSANFSQCCFRDGNAEARRTIEMPPAMLWLVEPSSLFESDRGRIRQAVVTRSMEAARGLLPRSDHLRTQGHVETAQAWRLPQLRPSLRLSSAATTKGNRLARDNDIL